MIRRSLVAVTLAGALGFALAAPPAAPPAAPAKPAGKPAAAPQPAAAKPSAAKPGTAKPAPAKPAVRPAVAARPTATEGLALLLLGRHKQAEEALGAVLAKNPRDLSAAIALAALLDARDDDGGAVLALARALAAGADSPAAAGALAALGRFAEQAQDGGASAVPVLTDLATGKLPVIAPEVRVIAANTLATTLARLGEPGRAHAFLAGPGAQVTRWRLVGPFGRFERLDLARAFPPEKGALDVAPGERAADGLAPLALDTTFADGRVVVPAQFRAFGVVYAVADFEAAAPAVVRVGVASPASFRVYVDGVLALEADRVREHPPVENGARAQLSAGRHRVLVKLANASRFTPFSLALHAANGAPAPLVNVAAGAPPTGTATVEPWPCPLDEALAFDAQADPAAVIARAWWLRERGLDESVGTVLRRATAVWPKATLFDASLGEWALAARTGASVEEDLAQARSRLNAAATADPGLLHARLLVARMDEVAGQLDEAWKAADGILAVRADDADALALQHRIAARRGWNVEAERRIERARAAAPGRADLLDFAIDHYRKSGAADKLEAALAEKWRRDPLDEAWPDFLTSAGRVDAARAAWEAMRAVRPSYLYPVLGLVRLETERGAYDRALALLDDAARMYPDESIIPARRAALLALAGKDADAVPQLRRALELAPSRIELWESLVRRGEPDRGLPWLANAADVLAAARKPARGTDSALLADIAAVTIDPQGGQTELYQGVHAVYTRAGVDREGELDVLPNARVQGIRIHKPDGRYTDVIAGEKRPVSLPGLEPGDSIEYVWRRYIPPYELVPGTLDNRTLFMFQGQDREYVLSRYVVIHPPELPVEVCGNTRGLTTTDEVKDGLRVRSWTAREMPRLPLEPHTADPLDTIPNVRLGLGMTWPDVGSLARSALASMLHPEPSLEALAAEIRKRAAGGGDEATARALHAVLREHVRPGGAALQMGMPASVALSSGEGNRVTIALALAKILGLDARLVLARPIEMRGAQLDCPSPAVFGYPLVEFATGTTSAFQDYSEVDLPYGSFPARLAGSDALEVPLSEKLPTRLIDLPRPENKVLEETSADLVLEADGRAHGTLTITLRDVAAAMLRRIFREAPAEQRGVMFRQMANDTFAGAIVEDTAVTGEKDPDADVVLTLRFSGASFGRRTQAGFAIPVIHHPLSLFNEYASLPSRNTALLVDAQEYRRDVLRVTLPAGFTAAEVPPPVTAGDTFGAYSLLVKTTPGGLEVIRNAIVPPSRIEPEGYGPFREFARTIDQAESREVGLTVASPSLAGPRG